MPICKPERNTSFPQGALWIGQGQWQFQGDLRTWKLSSLGCHPLALCHWVAGLWEHHSRLSLDGQSMLPKVGQVWEELWHQWPLLRCLQVKVIVQKRATLSSNAGEHRNAFGGGDVGGGESSKMVNNPVPSEDRRQSLFYILPLSLRWAIVFLPRRLRRAMKAKKSFRDVQRIFKFTIKSSMTIFSSQGNLWSVRAALKQFPFQPVF